MDKKYQSTVYACFVGCIVQAVVNNFAPLLFLTFHETYGIPLIRITFLVTLNFSIQFCVDLASVAFVDRIGYRASLLIAHGCAAVGIVLLAVLPQIMEPYSGILIAVVLYAIGGGLLEVVVSPVVEACPTPNKEKAMSLLHSFYCWGHVGVVLISTAYFSLFGIQSWRILACIWALIPLANLFVLARVPIASLIREGEKGMGVLGLVRSRLFWVLLLLMVCSGACEQAVSQWASAFAEQGLGVSKTVGDLAGPMMFAALMGISRAIYGKFGDRLPLERCILGCGVVCVLAYLLISLSPIPALSLLGCAVCGFSVGIFWPGTFSIAAAALPAGGTAMFALLALGGDVGCSGGPTLVGAVSSAFGDNLKLGTLFGVVFPALLLVGLLWKRRVQKRS